jgi:amyloid beta precursor protein binding protein 1
LPSNFKEKEMFRDLIRTGYYKNENNSIDIEENFEEAIKNVNNSIVPTQVKTKLDFLVLDFASIDILFYF